MLILKKRIIGIFCFLLISSACFSSPCTINEYYESGNNQTLVVPSLGLGAEANQKVVEKANLLSNFLKQFGPVKIVLDTEFSPESNEVVFIFGTEKTNAFLARNKDFLPVRYENQTLKFYNKELAGKNNWAIFLNPFPEGKFLVFYMPDLTKLERAMDVNHGATGFCIFAENSFSIPGESFLAEGNFLECAEKWQIDDLSVRENTLTAMLLVVSGNRGDNQDLKPGDILLKVNDRKLYSSNCSDLFGSLAEDKSHELLIRRKGQQTKVNFTLSDLKTINYQYYYEKIPKISSEFFLKECHRVVKSFEDAYVDSFDFMKSQKFQKTCEDLTSEPKTKDLSLLEASRRLMKFASGFNDGHIYTNFYKLKELLESDFLQRNINIFPFQPIISGSKLFVPKNSLGLNAGSEIVRFGDLNTNVVLQKMAMTTCGETFANKLSSFASDEFSYYFYLAFGAKTSFSLTLNFQNHLSEVLIKPVPFWEVENNVKVEGQVILKPLSKETLYLKLDYFQQNQEFSDMLTSLDKEFKKNTIKSLVIDIRENGGGNSMALEDLLCKLTSAKFRVYNGGRVKKSKLAESLAGAQFENGMAYGEKKAYMYSDDTTGNENAFKGRVYLVIGPKTFSTAFDCASVLKEMKRAILIGEPCGGRIIQTGNHFKLNLFKHLVTLSIPYKDFLPWGKKFKDFSYPKPNELIKPDFYAEVTESSIVAKIDPCLEVVEKLEKEFSKANRFENLHNLRK
ncbi:MAG: hypothetical protein KKB51_08655 [Candidatus Riflebacteria bacterium]|nr:hypothetical protein [Candidatus Riflebacteria bacterium]